MAERQTGWWWSGIQIFKFKKMGVSAGWISVHVPQRCPDCACSSRIFNHTGSRAERVPEQCMRTSCTLNCRARRGQWQIHSCRASLLYSHNHAHSATRRLGPQCDGDAAGSCYDQMTACNDDLKLFQYVTRETREYTPVTH